MDANSSVGPGADRPPNGPVELLEKNWRARISGQQTAFAWAIAAGLGAAFITAAAEVSAARMLFPVGIMAVYVWLVYPPASSAGMGWRAARIAQLADSAYFLGFLWTLWAMIDSFVLKSTTPQSAFRVFGYALVTTTAGMGIRLFLLNFRYGLGEQAEEAQFSVERNVQALSVATQRSCDSLQRFHDQTEKLNQHLENLAKSVEKLDRDFAETHRQTMKAVTECIEATVDEIREKLKGPVQEFDRAVMAFTANVKQQSQILTNTVRDCSATVTAAVTQASESVRKAIQDAGEQIAKDHKDLMAQVRRSLLEIVDGLKRLAQELDSIHLPLDKFKMISQALFEFAQGLSELAELLGPDGALRKNLDHLATGVETKGKSVSNALENLAARLNAVIIPEKVEIDISKLTAAIEELKNSVTKLLEKASDPRWEKISQTASDAIVTLTAAANNLRKAIETVEAAVKSLKERSGQKRGFWDRILGR